MIRNYWAQDVLSSRKMTFSRILTAVVLAAAALALVPSGAGAASVSGSISKLQSSGAIDSTKAAYARAAYRDARSLRKRVKGARRTAMTMQIRTVEAMARQNRITGDRVTPLFTTLRVNTDWFSKNGPASAGRDERFGDSRIIFQYFAGRGWEFHPLSNFAKLNAVWTDKSTAARRALGKYAYELISWGVNREGALTWEYYFPFAGSKAPFISSISQGTAVQALARAGNALKDPAITAAGSKAVKSFQVNAPVGLRVAREEGNHYIGYSGNRRMLILNMFLQSLDGLHDFSKITDDPVAWELYREGLKAARRDTAASDTGAWSLYAVGRNESDLHYHRLVTQFLEKICGETGEAIFCDTRTRFNSYLTQKPVVSRVKKSVKRGRIVVKFKLSKISTVRLRGTGGLAVATVGRGNRSFSVKRKGSTKVTLVVTDLAGNKTTVSK